MAMRSQAILTSEPGSFKALIICLNSLMSFATTDGIVSSISKVMWVPERSSSLSYRAMSLNSLRKTTADRWLVLFLRDMVGTMKLLEVLLKRIDCTRTILASSPLSPCAPLFVRSSPVFSNISRPLSLSGTSTSSSSPSSWPGLAATAAAPPPCFCGAAVAFAAPADAAAVPPRPAAPFAPFACEAAAWPAAAPGLVPALPVPLLAEAAAAGETPLPAAVVALPFPAAEAPLELLPLPAAAGAAVAGA
mmetsp:Transcript_44338/g.117341  ORF Transcript_44338/g.117341 Transcript_44338/m.117341 type:complete len:248 (-) Transcript_44338:110-853(-)